MSDITSNNKRIAKNTLLLYFRMLITMLISLYTSRVVLVALGVDNFGIYNVVGGVVTALAFLNGTISTASSRYITVALGKRDENLQKEVFSSVFIINIILCIFIIFLSETIGLWFLFKKMIIPIERMNAALWVYQISVITIVINIVSIPYNATIIAHEKMKAFAYISLFDAFAKLGVSFLITTNIKGDKLIIYSILILIIQLTDRIVYSKYCANHFKESTLKWTWNHKLLKEMICFISWAAYGSFVSIGFTQGLNILLNLFFGPSVNAARGIAVQVQNAINAFTLNFQTAINPQLIKSVAQNNFEQSRKLLIASSKYSFFLLCIIGIPLIGNTEWVLKLWLKEVPQYTADFVRLMILIAIFQSLANPLRMINQAEGNIKKFQKYECTFLLLILPFSYAALKFGLAAIYVFIIQLTIEIFVQIIRIYIVLPKIKMQKVEYLMKIYIRIIPVLIIPLSVTIIFPHSIAISSNIYHITNILVTVFTVLLILYLIGITSIERAIIHKKIRNL